MNKFFVFLKNYWDDIIGFIYSIFDFLDDGKDGETDYDLDQSIDL